MIFIFKPLLKGLIVYFFWVSQANPSFLVVCQSGFGYVLCLFIVGVLFQWSVVGIVICCRLRLLVILVLLSFHPTVASALSHNRPLVYP